MIGLQTRTHLCTYTDEDKVRAPVENMVVAESMRRMADALSLEGDEESTEAKTAR